MLGVDGRGAQTVELLGEQKSAATYRAHPHREDTHPLSPHSYSVMDETTVPKQLPNNADTSCPSQEGLHNVCSVQLPNSCRYPYSPTYKSGLCEP